MSQGFQQVLMVKNMNAKMTFKDKVMICIIVSKTWMCTHRKQDFNQPGYIPARIGEDILIILERDPGTENNSTCSRKEITVCIVTVCSDLQTETCVVVSNGTRAEAIATVLQPAWELCQLDFLDLWTGWVSVLLFFFTRGFKKFHLLLICCSVLTWLSLPILLPTPLFCIAWTPDKSRQSVSSSF